MDKRWIRQYSDKMRETPEYNNDTVYMRFARIAKIIPDREAIVYGKRSYPYGRCLLVVNQVAQALHEIGMKEGDTISICLPNIPSAVVLILAANRIGVKVSLINRKSVKNDIISTIESVHSKVLVTFPYVFDRVAESLGQTEIKNIIICKDTDYLCFSDKVKCYTKTASGHVRAFFEKMQTPAINVPSGIKVSEWYELLEMARSHEQPVYEKNDEVAIYFHTGGATGEPKTIMASSRAITSLASQIKVNFEFDDLSSTAPSEMNRALCVADISFTYGLCFGILSMLLNGYAVALLPYFGSARVADYIFLTTPKVLIGYPFVFSKMVENRHYYGKSLSFIKHVISGEDEFTTYKLHSVNSFLAEHGCLSEVQESYGISEALSVCAVNPLGKGRDKSLGVPIPDCFIKIVDGQTLAEQMPGTLGEICVFTPAAMMGYYEDQVSTARVLRKHRDGRVWIHTGDIGHMDEDGYFYFDYAEKRCVNIGGVTVFPRIVEDVIRSIYGVSEVCVIDVPDVNQGKKLAALIVPEDGFFFDNVKMNSLKNSIELECEMMLLPTASPSIIEFRAYFPKTAIGKPDYRTIAKDYIEENFNDDGSQKKI